MRTTAGLVHLKANNASSAGEPHAVSIGNVRFSLTLSALTAFVCDQKAVPLFTNVASQNTCANIYLKLELLLWLYVAFEQL